LIIYKGINLGVEVFRLFKWVLYFCLFFGTIGLIIGLVFSQFPVLETGAKSYVYALKSKKYVQAYGYMSQNYRQKYTYDEFMQSMKASGLYYATDWSTKDAFFNDSKSKGVARGVVTLNKSGRIYKVPIEINFIHLEGEFAAKSWYIDSITQIEEEP